ncbi:MAG TPA: hypothetical protein VKB50_11485 [Vicinamibacterales bacterium]|nr:hypothetical protein [Vicinamibacterales bacterium]
MRRGLVLLVTVICCATTASAQNSGAQIQTFTFFNAASAAVVRANPDDVVARMMSFDRDHDGVISKSELPERMQPLLMRGDAGLDGTLNAAEIRTLALGTPTVSATERGFGHPGGYTFVDQGEISSRSHIEGALADLRLDEATNDQARAIVSAFIEALDADASADLLEDMGKLLTPEQLADFRQKAFDRRAFVRSIQQPAQVILIGGDLGRLVGIYGLAPEQLREAHAAVDRFKERLRPADEDRSALLKQMKGILTTEERDNFRAALERRPLVKAGPGGAQVVGRTFRGDVFVGSQIVPLPPARVVVPAN